MTQIRPLNHQSVNEINEIESIFKDSMHSIKPSYSQFNHLLFKRTLYPYYTLIILFSWYLPYLSIFIMMVNILIYLGLVVYIEWYIYKFNPKKHYNKYQSNNHQILVLTYHDHIIGFFSVQPYKLKHAWITYMFIHSKYQKQGYGTLINHYLNKHYYQTGIYLKFSGGTSSLQTSQIKLQNKYFNQIKQYGNNCDIQKIKRCPWQPIYEIRFTYS